MVQPLEKKYGPTIPDEFSNILTISKRSPIKIESDRGNEIHTSVFQHFLQPTNIHQYSRSIEHKNIHKNIYKNQDLLIKVLP